MFLSLGVNRLEGEGFFNLLDMHQLNFFRSAIANKKRYVHVISSFLHGFPKFSNASKL